MKGIFSATKKLPIAPDHTSLNLKTNNRNAVVKKSSDKVQMAYKNIKYTANFQNRQEIAQQTRALNRYLGLCSLCRYKVMK